MMKLITEATDLEGKYVIVRSSCNVPLDSEGNVTNQYRILRALPTLTFLSTKGAKVIVLAHIGRDENDTLKPVFSAFKKHIDMIWGGSVGTSELNDARLGMRPGDILMVENLRQDPRESQNDSGFTEELASLGDIYVNDAFDNIHRDHASMVGLPKTLPSYAGITLADEIKHLKQVMEPEHPSLFILGGAKFETKLPLIEKYLTKYDNVFVGGALANDILLADGYEVGQSLVSAVTLKGKSFLSDKKLMRPIDVVVTGESGNRIALVNEVKVNEKIIDMGPKTVASLAKFIDEAKTILWNGPLGIYEAGAGGSTETVATLTAQSSANSVLGGGDTVAAVEDLGLNDRFGFVSIGGGAMLTLLEDGTTSSLEAIGYEK